MLPLLFLSCIFRKLVRCREGGCSIEYRVSNSGVGIGRCEKKGETSSRRITISNLAILITALVELEPADALGGNEPAELTRMMHKLKNQGNKTTDSSTSSSPKRSCMMMRPTLSYERLQHVLRSHVLTMLGW